MVSGGDEADDENPGAPMSCTANAPFALFVSGLDYADAWRTFNAIHGSRGLRIVSSSAGRRYKEGSKR